MLDRLLEKHVVVYLLDSFELCLEMLDRLLLETEYLVGERFEAAASLLLDFELGG